FSSSGPNAAGPCCPVSALVGCPAMCLPPPAPGCFHAKDHFMNQAATDGITLMPAPFIDGLASWSSEDGVPGSATYEDADDAALVASDPDFGACLELEKTESVKKLRYMGEIPVLPGCFLRVSARIKVMSGLYPSVRIAAWAGAANGTHVEGLDEIGPET